MTEVTLQKEFLGMPRHLALGYLALILFMVGDGVEQAFLSRYLVDCGFTVEQAATVFGVYGVTLTLGAWLTGTLSEMFGPQRCMRVGLIIWVSFHVLFLVFGVGQLNYPIMLLTYGIRGFGLPLFAYSFLIWIAFATPNARLGSAYGWFWFCYAGGLQAAGSLVPSISLPILGYMGTLWFSFVFIIPGGLIGCFLFKEIHGLARLKDTWTEEEKKEKAGAAQLMEFIKGITIIWENKRVGMALIVRIINTTSQYGFTVCLPLFFTDVIGFTTAQWLLVWGIHNVIHICSIMVSGWVGNRIKWHNETRFWGCLICGTSCLLIYYFSTIIGPNIPLQILLFSTYAIGLSGFTCHTATMASLDERKGQSVGIYNLGAGLSTVTGPAIVGAVYPTWGLGAVVWIFFGLYMFAFVLTSFLNVHEKDEEIAARKALRKAQKAA